MGMDVQVGGGKKKGRAAPEMNVTPLVDVVLVLLIIFMVVTPLMHAHFWIHVPAKSEEVDEPPAQPDPSDAPIVVTVQATGELRINRDARTVTMSGRPVHLSARELDLLMLLAERAGIALPRRYLFDTIWGPKFYGDERALDVYIRALRKKIEPDPDHPAYIHTVRGVGYRLEEPVTP